MMTTHSFALKIKFVLKIRQQCVGRFNGLFIIETNKEALTVLCSVIKH